MHDVIDDVTQVLHQVSHCDAAAAAAVDDGVRTKMSQSSSGQCDRLTKKRREV